MGFWILRIVKVFGGLFLDLRTLSLILEIVFLHLLENDLQVGRKTFLGRCAAAVLLGKRREGRLKYLYKGSAEGNFPCGSPSITAAGGIGGSSNTVQIASVGSAHLGKHSIWMYLTPPSV